MNVTRRNKPNQFLIAVLWCCVATVALSSIGCTRPFWRKYADDEAYHIVRQKTRDPRWPLEDYTIEIDPLSRMYDPFDPDCPPMPPDDPAAHRYMHCVDGKHGYHAWHANGDTNQIEGPNWYDNLPRCENGNVLLDERLAVELALLHSPGFQRELEDLYLSALDVSFERFRFDTQFFGGTDLFFRNRGRNAGRLAPEDLNTSPFQSSSQLDLSKNLEARRLFASGGELVVGFANSLIWQFAGPTTNATNSLLDFTFIQPLLRMGGRIFVLERLTIAERALLANVRQMERFRRGFYVETITGRDSGAGPTRRGGVFGGAGLEGFSGVGGGGFGQLTGGFATAGVVGGTTGGAGAGQAGGFLGLLQIQQDLRNQQANIAALESSVDQLEAFFRAGTIDYFQVELARQALYNAQSLLLNTELAYANAKDDFKFNLGISQDIKIELNDKLIEPFQLIEPNAIASQNKLTGLQRELGDLIIEIIETAAGDGDESETGFLDSALPDRDDEADDAPDGNGEIELQSFEQSSIPAELDLGRAGDRPRDGIYAASYQQPVDLDSALDSAPLGSGRALEWNDALRKKLEELRELIKEAKAISDKSEQEGLPRAAEDIKELETSLGTRREYMQELRERIQRQLDERADTCLDNPPPEIDVDAILPFDPARLAKLPAQLTATTGDVQRRFASLSEALEGFDQAVAEIIDEGENLEPQALYQRLGEKVFAPVPSALNELSANLLSMILVQVRARTQKANLVPIEMDWREALEIARVNRRDWMNARASLVDSWRLIQFNANALEGDLNLIFEGDISNVGDNPFDLSGSTGRMRMGVEFDAPLTRIAERNTYRQALIEYQQARRAYYRFVDGVTNGLRVVLRGIEVNQVNFELRRAAVEVAVAQVELARLVLQEPPRPDETQVLGATTARDLVTALTDLLNVQNDFLSVWISQESLRRSLDFDLGTMQLDGSGVWLDPGPIADGGLDLDGEFVPREFPQWGEDGIERLPEPGANAEGVDGLDADGPRQPLRPGGNGAAGDALPLPDDSNAKLLPAPPAEVFAIPIPATEIVPTSTVTKASAVSLEVFRSVTQTTSGQEASGSGDN